MYLSTMPHLPIQYILLMFVPTLRIGNTNMGAVQAFSVGNKRPLSFQRTNEWYHRCLVDERDEAFRQGSSSSLCMSIVELPPVNLPYEDMQIKINPTSPAVMHIGSEIEVRHVTRKNKPSNIYDSASDTKVKTKKSRKGIKMKKKIVRTARPALSIPSYSVNRRTFKRSSDKSLLTREEEAKLSFAIRTLRKAIEIRDQLSYHVAGQTDDFIHEPSELEWAEACGVTVNKLRRIMISGQEARSRLVAKNVGLVVQIAKRYHNSRRTCNNLTVQDMIQEGNLGLMEAAERFDPTRGFKFCTYAAYWVRQRITKSIADHSRLIRLPVHVHTMVGKIIKARHEMSEKIGRTPSDPELAHELGISMDKLKMYMESSRNVLSLEKQICTSNYNAKDRQMTLSDKISCNLPTPEDDAQVNHLRQDIRAIMDHLNTNEREIVTLRFGLDDGSPNTVDEVATRMNLSREQVRLLEARAINKLRHPGRNYKLKDYIESHNEEHVHNGELPPGRTPEQIWSF